ncbi:MAG: IS91 family transposase [Deltaproteobacteria bacterium]|nr:IS91 family transposase [Deltaproteobacteria bacterium]MBW2219345.1 IS91 family transposase [Deltaproteobacteria bacterium]
MKNSLEVADIFGAYGPVYREAHGGEMPLRQLRVMNAIEICRTMELGGHVEECDECGTLKISYNSCRNRHCPKCQFLDKERWLEARKKDILPTHYFHVVFTIPEQLRPIALRNQKVVYGILFKASSETLNELAKNPKHLGAQIGFTALLHTWTQLLIDHPHIHCIVPGGGLSLDGKRWVCCRKKFFIPVAVISALFRGKFLYYLKKAYYSGELYFPGKIEESGYKKAFEKLCTALYGKKWVVDSRPAFKTAESVIDYLGRYTHRVAITNDRIVKFEGDQVTFRYRDRDDNDKIKYTTLDVFEFIRRFLFHVLPDGFMKIRHYGILSNRNKNEKLLRCKKLLGVPLNESDDKNESWQVLLFRITGIDPRLCPHCGKGNMVRKENFEPRRGRCPP